MPSRPPFFAQERPETCALACLRMILAHEGISVSEEELVKEAQREPGGVHIDELARLAERHDLRAEIRELDIDSAAQLLASGTFAIAFGLFPVEGRPTLHAVIPVEITREHVVVLDPLEGEKQIPRHEFLAARRWQSNLSLVFGKR
ncbi:MAG: C39 family peptidase [Planctomycetes bacterium]|nr:C39 family peptidase [Planctomycetota bacterium]